MISTVTYGHVARAMVAGSLLAYGCSAPLATVLPGPVQFDAFLPPQVSAMVAIGVGGAGALASLDDAGKRELIGLATAAQVGLVPAWLGIGLVQGFDTPPAPRLLSFALNLALTVLAAALVYALRCAPQSAQRSRPALPVQPPRAASPGGGT